MGYSAPVASSNDLYDFLASVESDFVAYRANALRSSPRTSAGERTVADQFKRAFEDGLKSLENMDLSRLNIAYEGKWYIGGISEAEKSAVSSDTDRVAPRFYRDIGENPERGS